ncbi:MAG: response regulator [Chloroflexota bacterium]
MSYSVLVAEDDKIIRRLARHILERAGFEVDEAADGLEALAQIETKKPDLLLLGDCCETR